MPSDEDQEKLARDEDVDAAAHAGDGDGDAGEDAGELDLSKVSLVSEPAAEDAADGATEDVPSPDEASGNEDASPDDPEEAKETETPEPKVSRLPDDEAQQRAVIEAILFTSPEPMRPARIAKNLGADTADVRRLIQDLTDEYERTGRAFKIVAVAGGFQMLTREEYAPYLGEFERERASGRISSAALETLAIIAYRQPIVRAEIEKVRGVGCGPILRTLLDKGLVRIAGRADQLGSPLLYATTPKFLEHFGLNSLKDLPRSAEFKAG